MQTLTSLKYSLIKSGIEFKEQTKEEISELEFQTVFGESFRFTFKNGKFVEIN